MIRRIIITSLIVALFLLALAIAILVFAQLVQLIAWIEALVDASPGWRHTMILSGFAFWICLILFAWHVRRILINRSPTQRR